MTTEAMSLTAATPAAGLSPSLGSVARPARFVNTLAAEWTKLATLRATYLTLGLGVVLSIATTALVCLALGSTQKTWAADFNPITTSMVGNIWALILFSVFGAMVMSREYSGGLIRLTLTATPRRGRVFGAKLILVTGIILGFGLLTTVAMFLVGQAVLGAYGRPVAGLGDANARWMVLGLGAVMPFFPLVGLALGGLLRSTAGAITAVLGFLWLPVIFGAALPLWARQHVMNLLPGNGLDSITINHVEHSPSFSTPLVGAVIAGAWLAVIVGAAYLTFLRRDA